MVSVLERGATCASVAALGCVARWRPRRPWSRLAILAVVAVCQALPAAADSTGLEEEEPRFRFGIEVKGHWRSSDDTELTTNFPDPFREGQNIRIGTVEPGDHLELSVVTLSLDGRFRDDRLSFRLKVDTVDEYDKNPTSTDNDVDLDEAWLRFGREREPGDPAMASGFYFKIGKMPAFERQDDRHLESYGLVSTAFNRMEDIGGELGWRAGRHLWGRVTVSEGNPFFFRDPTALAGDNGTPEILTGALPDLASGLAILYDAETEDISFDNPEIGVGLGLHFGDETGDRALDVLLWARRRELADTVDLTGTFYGGDLDFLRGPLDLPETRFPFTDNDKQEIGFNVWLYRGGFSLFLQGVDQDAGGLGRTAFEAEVAWQFDLPVVASLGGKQAFSFIQPAIRYSRIDPDFGLPALTPSPSFAWEWEKLDIGVRFDIWNGLDLTAEWALNRFVVRGRDIENNEALVTLRYKR